MLADLLLTAQTGRGAERTGGNRTGSPGGGCLGDAPLPRPHAQTHMHSGQGGFGAMVVLQLWEAGCGRFFPVVALGVSAGWLSGSGHWPGDQPSRVCPHCALFVPMRLTFMSP